MQLSRADIEGLKEKAKRAQATVRNAREYVAEQVGHVVRTAEVGGVSFAFGVANGYTGGVEVLGVPLDLGAGVAAHLAAFLMGGDLANHLHSMGDGAVAAYSTISGVGVGAKLKARNLAANQPAGNLPAPPGGAAAGNYPSPNADHAMAAAMRTMQAAGGR
jgi:hypothetical protein